MQQNIRCQLLACLFLIASATVVGVSSRRHDESTGVRSCPANQTYGFGCEAKCETTDEYLDCRHDETAGCVCNQGYCRSYSRDGKRRELCEEALQMYCPEVESRKCVRLLICDSNHCDYVRPPGGLPSPRPFDELTKPPQPQEPIDCPANEVLGTGCEVQCATRDFQVMWDCASEGKPQCLCEYNHCRDKDSSCVKREMIEYCYNYMTQFGSFLPPQKDRYCLNSTAQGGWPSPRPVVVVDPLPSEEEEEE